MMFRGRPDMQMMQPSALCRRAHSSVSDHTTPPVGPRSTGSFMRWILSASAPSRDTEPKLIGYGPWSGELGAVLSDAAVDVVRKRAWRARDEGLARWGQLVDAARFGDIDAWASRLAAAGRVTLNFHPDRVTRSATTVSAGLLDDGRYRSQWVTGISNGSRSAVAGGERQRFERALFDGTYDMADPARHEFPVYGALDLLRDPHGG